MEKSGGLKSSEEYAFLIGLYKEERELFNKIQPLLEEFVMVKRMIIYRGGSPRCNLGEVNTITVQSKINNK